MLTARRLAISGGGQTPPGRRPFYATLLLDRMTDASENITLPHTSYEVGNNSKFITRWLQSRVFDLKQPKIKYNEFIEVCIVFVIDQSFEEKNWSKSKFFIEVIILFWMCTKS